MSFSSRSLGTIYHSGCLWRNITEGVQTSGETQRAPEFLMKLIQKENNREGALAAQREGKEWQTWGCRPLFRRKQPKLTFAHTGQTGEKVKRLFPTPLEISIKNKCHAFVLITGQMDNLERGEMSRDRRKSTTKSVISEVSQRLQGPLLLQSKC